MRRRVLPTIEQLSSELVRAEAVRLHLVGDVLGFNAVVVIERRDSIRGFVPVCLVTKLVGAGHVSCKVGSRLLQVRVPLERAPFMLLAELICEPENFILGSL